MTASDLEALQSFQWRRQPEAAQYLQDIVAGFWKECRFAATLAEQMRDISGTRFVDWIDCLVLPESTVIRRQLLQVGFDTDIVAGPEQVFRHPQGQFPRVVLAPTSETRIALKIDSVPDYLAAHALDLEIEGEPFAPLRRATVACEGPFRLDVVERHGAWGWTASPPDPETRIRAALHVERFRCRCRTFATDADGFTHARRLIQTAIRELGIDQTCSLFFAAEREFWQRRNRAAQVQKARQDRLGLGWGNHDHHTYRSSRACFVELIGLFELLGLECRERFYAGREAGWGAQVMENSRAGIVVFADVDLAPEEMLVDFAHQPLRPRHDLGTVGLWCALHGEAFLGAGMHHLECQFDFDALKAQLEDRHNISVMKPFTDFPYLRQAFTEGDKWPVADERIDRLLARHQITSEQARRFRVHGALGSHLENLERNDGYKGFNQKGVSEIIAATDPRLSSTETGAAKDAGNLPVGDS